MKKDFAKSDAKISWLVVLKGALFGILTSAVLIFIFAAILLLPGVRRGLAVSFALISLAVGTLVAAFYIAKKTDGKGLIIGAITGVAVFVSVTLFSFALNDGTITPNTLFRFIILLLSGTVGGILGANRRGSRKYLA